VGPEQALPLGDQVVGGLDTVPAVVPVHGEVATDKAGGAPLAQALIGLLQQIQGRLGAARRGVAAVEEGMHLDLLGAAAGSQLDHGDDMVLMAVDRKSTRLNS